MLLPLLPLLLMTGAPPPLETIARGGLSGIERPREVVIRNDADWRALWRQHASDEPLPPVDFSTRTVVAVFLGSRTTAGYAVEIVRIDREKAAATVHVRESRPQPDQMVAQVITSPFHIVSAPRLPEHVAFVHDAVR